jgi:4-amino-4-deoxy-L-arabinose transferase-like glycosyltransferase
MAIVDQKGEEGSWQYRRSRTQSGMSFFMSSGIQGYSWILLAVYIAIVYVPFLGNRVVRSAGDDKVYVSQAVEMARSGSWFLQTLGGEPNYYKGPLHYIFLRIGMIVFGNSMWATVWMNLFLVLIASVLLGKIVQRNMRDFPGWPFFVGMFFATCAGIYSHVFASQMEVETACLLAIGLYFLDKAGPRRDLHFWVVAGVAGWLKSPLHSVFLGTAALIFWGWSGELWPRVKSPRAWGAALVGVLVCCAGYAPAALQDWQNFYNTYVLRETLHKPANGSLWHYPVVPFFTYFLFPWALPALVAYYDGISRFWRRSRPIRSTPGSRRVVALGLSLILPSVAFFIWHPYRGQNYNLPVIAGLILMVSSFWASRSPTWDKYYQGSLALTALLLIGTVSMLTIAIRHFDPMPFWWSSWRLPLIWVGIVFTARGIWREGISLNMARPDALARRPLWMLLALGGLLTTLGEREMIDIRDRIYQSRKVGEKLSISYYNLPKHPNSCCTNIWSEWGYLNFMIPHPVSGLFNDAQLLEAVKRGDLILVPGDDWLADMHSKLDSLYPAAKWKVDPWKRWKTKGKNAQGVPAWKESWDTRDISKLEKDFYMVKIDAAP